MPSVITHFCNIPVEKEEKKLNSHTHTHTNRKKNKRKFSTKKKHEEGIKEMKN